jgi:hypothetical protein
MECPDREHSGENSRAGKVALTATIYQKQTIRPTPNNGGEDGFRQSLGAGRMRLFVRGRCRGSGAFTSGGLPRGARTYCGVRTLRQLSWSLQQGCHTFKSKKVRVFYSPRAGKFRQVSTNVDGGVYTCTHRRPVFWTPRGSISRRCPSRSLQPCARRAR